MSDAPAHRLDAATEQSPYRADLPEAQITLLASASGAHIGAEIKAEVGRRIGHELGEPARSAAEQSLSSGLPSPDSSVLHS